MEAYESNRKPNQPGRLERIRMELRAIEHASPLLGLFFRDCCGSRTVRLSSSIVVNQLFGVYGCLRYTSAALGFDRLREASWPFIPIPQSEDFLAEK